MRWEVLGSLTELIWARMELGGILWLQGPPGSSLPHLLSRIAAKWRKSMPGALCHLQCDDITARSDLDLALQSLSSPREGDALILHQLDPSLALPGLFSNIIGRGWKSVLVTSAFDAPVGLPDHFVVPPLSIDQTLDLIESGSGDEGGAEESKIALAHAIGGSYGAALSAAELLELAPPAEVEGLCSDVFRIFDLSPRNGLLMDEALECLERLSGQEAVAAVKWGLWGVPLSPEALTSLFGESGLSLADSLVKLHLAQPLGRRVRPLPHWVWAVRRRESEKPSLEAEAWGGLTQWMVEQSGDDHLALALCFERRSASSPAWVQAWSKAAKMAGHLGFTESERTDLKLMAACHAAMGDDLEQAELLINSIQDAERNPRAPDLQVVLGTLKHLQGRAEEGAKLLRAGVEAAKSQGRKALQAAACYRLGFCLLDLGQVVASSSALRQGIDAASLGGLQILPKLMDLQAFVVGLQGRGEESLKIQLESVRAWELSDLSCAASLAKLGYGQVCWLRGLPDQAESEIAAATVGLIEEELLDDAVTGFSISAAAAMARGGAALALGFVERAARLGRVEGSSIALEWGKVTRCWALMALGRFPEADALMEKLSHHVLMDRHRLLFPAIVALYAARASLKGEHLLAVLLIGAADSERKRTSRQISQGEQMVLSHFLGASRIALYPDEYAAFEAAGSLISAEEAISLLLLDRRLVDCPEGGALRPKKLTQLGEREREVLQLLGEGLTNTQMAEVLEVTLGTIKRQVHSLKSKLKSGSRVSLMHAAQRVNRAVLPEGSVKSR